MKEYLTDFLVDLAERLFRTETLVVIVALYLVGTGRVQTMQEGIALAAAASTYIGGRSYAKASQTKALLGSIDRIDG